MPAGRPTDYDPAFCERVIELGREGKSHAQIAAELDVSRMSLYRWAEQHPEFSDAITYARDLAQAWFENMGQSGLLTPGFNASLWAKQVSARFPDDYTEKTRREIEAKVTLKRPEEMTDDELAAIAAGGSSGTPAP